MRRAGVVLVVATAAPCAFAVELLARSFIVSRNFELLRAELRPILTPVVWALFLLSVPVGLAGVALYRRLVLRGLAKTPDLRARVEEGALLLASCLPQIPALLAMIASLLGAGTPPVLATLAITTVGVLAQGASSPRGPSTNALRF